MRYEGALTLGELSVRALVLALVLTAAVAAGVAVAADPATEVATVGVSHPLKVAQAALARSRASLQCRFAFTLEEEGVANAPWATWPADAKQTLQFDPRRAIGERWKIIRNEKNVRKDIRRLFNLGGRSDPHADLLTLTLEGDVDITDLQLKEERADVWVFSFKPFATTTVNPEAHVFLNALVGELWVSRQSGEIVRRTLLIDEPFDSGLGRVRVANFMREYLPGQSGYAMTRGTAQKMTITVQGRGIESEGRQTISEIQPICDPVEVRAIAEMEARGVSYERSDSEPRTGSRVRGYGRSPADNARSRKR